MLSGTWHCGTGGATHGIPVCQRPISEIDGNWWVIHTKARHEKALAAELDQSGIDLFLPLVTVTRRYGRRRVNILLPLFPGYLFVAFVSEEDRIRCLRTQRVARTIHVENQDRLRAELEHIRRALVLGERLQLYPGIKTGRRCRVISGPLSGVEGVVLRRNKTGRIYLEVDILGQSAMVDVELTHLESIN